MKRHIIAYCGKQNSGKTTTLTLLHNMLAKALPLCNNQPRPIPSPDFCSYFFTAGIGICISTGGDDAATIGQGLEYFEKHQGQILIIAGRTRGMTINTLREYISTNKDVALHCLYAKQADCSDYYSLNSDAAVQLKNMIFQYINLSMNMAGAPRETDNYLNSLINRQIELRKDLLSNKKELCCSILDTCTYRILGRATNGLESIITKAQLLAASELQANVTSYASAITVWELISHLDEIDNAGNKSSDCKACQQALLFLKHHANNRFIYLPELDVVSSILSCYEGNKSEILKPDNIKNIYRISSALSTVTHHIDEYIEKGKDASTFAAISWLAEELKDYKTWINSGFQSLVNKLNDDISEDEFASSLHMQLADTLMQPFTNEFRETIEEIKLIPFSFEILDSKYRKWYKAIRNEGTGENWAIKNKIANTILDALQLAPLSAPSEPISFLFVTNDKWIKEQGLKLTNTYHAITDINSYKKIFNFE